MLKKTGLISIALLSFLIAGPAAAGLTRVSWYGSNHHGNHTASGERFDRWGYTAAHASWPFGTQVRVTNPVNGSSVVVRVNDRIGGNRLDISEQAAIDLGIRAQGVATLNVEVMHWGNATKILLPGESD
ncbi:MAG: septal ring lytic transglycosylase RlpA family protein [Cyanothece sp. SIO1E1]|nr:septal ring lytic transglycosylase RlpA family protein [Cyanothece sp. SIO1E1]